MPSNLPRTNHGGGRTPDNRWSEFPADTDLLRKQTNPETVVFENSTDTGGSRPYPVAACEYWSIYVFGDGSTDVDVQVCMNPKYETWVTLNSSALGNASVYEGSGGQHPWVRVLINNAGAGTSVHLFRKYSTY